MATLLQPASRTIAAAVALAVLPPGIVLRAADGDGNADAAAATGAAVAIRVGDSPIFRAELDATLRRALQGRSLGPQQRDRLTAETVEQLVDERLLRREIEVRKITVEEEEVSQIVTRMRGQLADRKIPIETFLAQSGRDEASLRAQIRLEVALTKMLRTHVTPEALDAAFTKNKRDLDGTLVRVSHIVLRPDPGRGDETAADMERRASAIRTAILRGELSFAAAATQHSAGPSRRQGGDLGFIPRHGGVDEEFSRRAFALAKGEISQPFATAFGVHVVLVTDIQPGNLGPAEVRTQVERMVVQEVIREIVGRGRRDTPIEYAPDVPHFAADSNRDDTARKVIVERPTKQQP